MWTLDLQHEYSFSLNAQQAQNFSFNVDLNAPSQAMQLAFLPMLVGAQGEQGLQGIQGLPGVQGTQGDIGLTGAQGLQGIQGVDGVPGVQGLPGIDGDKTYIHAQNIAMAVWTVPHNLNKYPSITVADSAGAVIEADVVYIDINIVQITHGIALTGAVYCN